MATLRQLLNTSVPKLQHCSSTPFLDALLLASLAMGVSKERALAELSSEIPEELADSFSFLLARRTSGTPIAYIRGVQEFYGRDFIVSPSVLIPRPETELLVELAEGLSGSRVLDLCCGSGCIGISLKLQQPWRQVTCSDISEDALEIARQNAERLHGEITLLTSDLFTQIPGTFDIIISNPPYLNDEQMRSASLRSRGEPQGALYGGRSGLEFIEKIIFEGFSRLAPEGYLMIEIDHSQRYAAKHLMEEAGFSEIQLIDDLAGLTRVVMGRRLTI